LNFSTHVNGTKALTGRVWQSTASGVLVLEEENDPIKEFFAPYIHYVPFFNATELSLLLEFFHKHENYRQKIASQAANWSALHFSNHAIWQRIFAALQR
jgi:spore maturation protein CgeB